MYSQVLTARIQRPSYECKPDLDSFIKLAREVYKNLPLVKRLSNSLNIFTSPKGYLPYKEYSTIRSYGLLNIKTWKEIGDEINWHSAFYESEFVSNNIKTYFLEKDLIDASILTEMPNPQNIDKSAYPFYDFSIPLGTLKCDDGFDIYRIKLIDKREQLRLEGIEFDPTIHSYYQIYAHTIQNCIISVPIGIGRDELADGAFCNEDMIDTSQIIENVALNAMMMIINMPSNLKEGKGRKAAGFGKTGKRQPIMLGMNSEKVYYTNKNSGSSIYRGSMPPHIRRGHWRRSRTGAGRRHTKWNWILPMKINC